MTVSRLDLAPTALIVGCGYVGTRLAERLVDEGAVVYATTRSPSRIDALAAIGTRPLVLHAERRKSYEELKPVLNVDSLDVYWLVPPGRNVDEQPTPRQVVIDGLTNLIDVLRDANVRRMLLTSSTGVYGQSDGAAIDVDTPSQPNDHRGQLLLNGEQLWLDAGDHAHVVRLAGLYGPGRVIGEKALREGQPIVGDGDAYLNLIHVDDAADLLVSIMTAPSPGRVELGCDGSPVKRIDYYSEVARRLGVNPPKLVHGEDVLKKMGIDPARVRRASSKRCDHRVTCERTGWQPRFRDYRDGLNAILREASSATARQDASE